MSGPKPPSSEPLLDVRGLRTLFPIGDGEFAPVDGVDLRLGAGETLGLAGESGSGKSLLALSILGLVPEPGRIAAGSVRFGGRDLLQLDPEALRSVRGRELALIFQEPAAALNPVLSVGEQIVEVLRLHRGLDRRAARAEAVRALGEVGIADPEQRFGSYSHQLSGGLRQRAMIAMAMVSRPKLLIADEPTTALDVTIQAQVLELLAELQSSTGMALLFISHDLAVLSQIADRTAVMYAGRIVESGPTRALFQRPRHPYTLGLLRSLPELTPPGAELVALPGQPPRPGHRPSGCRFRSRCSLVQERCASEEPHLGSPAGASDQLSACHFAADVPALGGER